MPCRPSALLVAQMRVSSPMTDSWPKELQKNGYTLLKKAGQPGVSDITAKLGKVVQTTEVRNEPAPVLVIPC